MKTGVTSSALGPSFVERGGHHLQAGRANVGAMGEPEKDQHIAAKEIFVGDALAGVIGQRERPADQRLCRRPTVAAPPGCFSPGVPAAPDTAK